MSLKANNTSHRSGLDRSRIFFRSPILLKIVAWLGSLSFLSTTGIAWADLKPISVSETQAQELIRASEVARISNDVKLPTSEIFGPHLPNSTPQQATPKVTANREVPVPISPGTVSIVNQTGTTLPQRTGSVTADNRVLRIGGAQGAIEIPVPSPRQSIVPGNSAVQAKTRTQVQPKIGNSTPKTGIDVASNRPWTSATPTPVAYDTSLPKGAQRALKVTVVAPMRPSKIGTLASSEQFRPAAIQVDIPVPPPISQIVKVRPVAQLPQLTGDKVVPQVTPLPSIRNGKNSVQYKPLAFAKNSSTEQGIQLGYPLSSPAPITSSFGWRIHPITGSRRFHAGIDIGAPMGAPVVAAGSGTVVAAGWVKGYGKAITIEHNGIQQTLYGHLSEVFVQAGQTIDQGTVIGRVGSTGNSSGPHLHFESRMSTSDGWVAVDPGTEVKYAMANLRREIDLTRKDSSPKIN